MARLGDLYEDAPLSYKSVRECVTARLMFQTLDPQLIKPSPLLELPDKWLHLQPISLLDSE